MNSDERVFSLSDLFAILLRNIIPIICITLAVTLLGFVFSLKKVQANYLSPAAQPQQDDVDKAKARFAFLSDVYESASGTMANLEDEKLSYLWESVGTVNEAIAQLSEYCSSSPIMSLDPFHCTVYDVSLLARSNSNVSSNSSSSIGGQAASAISSICTMDNSVLEKVREILGIEQDLDYVRQLIRVYSDFDVVHIRLYCIDENSAETAVDYLCRTVVDRLRSDNIGFSVEEISRYVGVIVDGELEKQQIDTLNTLSQSIQALSNAENALTGLNSTIDKLRSASSDLEDKYASSEKEIAALQASLTQGDPPQQFGGISLKTIVLFFALGLSISCISILCFWVLSGKLFGQSELLSRYSFPVLGVLPGERKVLFGNTIKRLEGESQASIEDISKVVAQALFRVTEKHSACFVSSIGSEKASVLLPYLDGKIGICGDILNDPEAVKDLDNFDSIILIEQRRKSVLSQIDSEVLRAKAFGKEILGIILI